jgi:hypothetical protein
LLPRTKRPASTQAKSLIFHDVQFFLDQYRAVFRVNVTSPDHHRNKTVYVAWDNANTHEDEEVEAVLRGAAGRLVLLYLPTYSP